TFAETACDPEQAGDEDRLWYREKQVDPADPDAKGRAAVIGHASHPDSDPCDDAAVAKLMRMARRGAVSAVAFLQQWEPQGPWVLTAIVPDGKQIETRTFSPNDLLAPTRWIEGWQGKGNLYFSVNRPRCPLGKKATKADIGQMIALHVDIDPTAG